PEHLQGRVVSATAGLRTTVVILDDGSVDVFGGVNHNRANIDPRRFPAHLEAYKVDIAWLSAGVMTTCGRVYVLSPALRPYRDIPEELYDIVQGNIIDFAMSNRVATVIVEGNRVYSWGDSTDIAVHVPDAIQGRAVQIRGGTDHFVALLDDGSLYAWGGNWNRQLRVPRGNDFVEVFSGYHHGYAMRADGSIETWGLNGFPFGSDHMGRCIFTRMWTAGRYSLTIGTVAIFIATFIGVTLGAIAGYFGGVVDNFIMRFGEAVGSIPFLPLALILNFHFGGDLPPVQALLVLMIVLGVLTWPPIMRLVRGQVLQARQTEYVLGARALGVKEGKIIARHILPNILSVIIVQFALGLAGSMLTESTLGFLGFGINEPTPTWGNMLNGSGSTVTLRYEWWRWVFPAAALVIATLSINLVGDGLREAIDPRTRGR
ncbi:MAG: ABC transporter permease subunit, partial [Defluviitaleaceae bacterium]|nr:ABC transporter permease subunit [Defluviitaleaceae bacterium]